MHFILQNFEKFGCLTLEIIYCWSVHEQLH